MNNQASAVFNDGAAHCKGTFCKCHICLLKHNNSGSFGRLDQSLSPFTLFPCDR
ncbi:MAG: hypothetical protein RLZZ336_1639 [Cyanobacteriota bacterium]